MIFVVEGQHYKALDARPITREEFEERLRFWEDRGRVLPFEWEPEDRD